MAYCGPVFAGDVRFDSFSMRGTMMRTAIIKEGEFVNVVFGRRHDQALLWVILEWAEDLFRFRPTMYMFSRGRTPVRRRLE